MWNEERDDSDHPMDGFIVGCAIGVFLWLAGYVIFEWVLG